MLIGNLFYSNKSAMEGESSFNRITLALSTLKSDLMEMRSQDVKLMKQLISINTTISTMNSRKRSPMYRSASFGSAKQKPNMDKINNRRSADIVCNLKNPLVRHRSAPLVVELRRSDAFDHSQNDIDAECRLQCGSEGDVDSISGSTSSLTGSVSGRNNSLPYMRPLPEEDDEDEKKYYGILMKNIKLWKYSQDSINSFDSDSGAES